MNNLLLDGIRKHAVGAGLIDDVARMFAEASRYTDDAVRIVQRISDLNLKKSARVLSARGRKQVAKKNFAMPASAAKSGKGQKGSYPIYDMAHARSALSRGKQHLSADEYSKLKARVYAKYPSLKKSASKEERIMETPILDSIKRAVLGGSDLGSLSGRSNAQQEALNAALGRGSAASTTTRTSPTRTERPGFLSRLIHTVFP